MTVKISHTIASTKKQQGVVLVIALLILVVMTVLGVSMLSTSSMEERMASNLQSKSITFQAAESCIRSALLPANAANRLLAVNSPNIIPPVTVNCVFNNVNSQVVFSVPNNPDMRWGAVVGFDPTKTVGYILIMGARSSLASGTTSSATFVGQVLAPPP